MLKSTRESLSRRRPQQSRSWQTSLAIQEAFTQLLQQQNYDLISIRKIVNLAGVGVGTFYEYFSSKEELARVCLHFHTKNIVTLMEGYVRSIDTRIELEQIVDQLLRINLDFHRKTPEKWGVFYMLERHYSGRPAYQKMYERFVQAWQTALLKTDTSFIDQEQVRDTAITLQTLVYGLLGHAFMSNDQQHIDFDKLEQRLHHAVHAYLRGL